MAIARDSSSPGAILNSYTTGLYTYTSPSFSPPANSMLVFAIPTPAGYNAGAPGWVFNTPTNTGTPLTWNLLAIQQDGSYSIGGVAVFWAYNAAAQTGITCTATVSTATSYTGQTACLDVWTGTASNFTGAALVQGSTTSSAGNIAITTTAAGSQVAGIYLEDFPFNYPPSSTDVAQGIWGAAFAYAGLCMYKAAPVTNAGPTYLNVNDGNTSGETTEYIVYEILAASGGGSPPPIEVPPQTLIRYPFPTPDTSRGTNANLLQPTVAQPPFKNLLPGLVEFRKDLGVFKYPYLTPTPAPIGAQRSESAPQYPFFQRDTSQSWTAYLPIPAPLLPPGHFAPARNLWQPGDSSQSTNLSLLTVPIPPTIPAPHLAPIRYWFQPSDSSQSTSKTLYADSTVPVFNVPQYQIDPIRPVTDTSQSSNLSLITAVQPPIIPPGHFAPIRALWQPGDTSQSVPKVTFGDSTIPFSNLQQPVPTLSLPVADTSQPSPLALLAPYVPPPTPPVQPIYGGGGGGGSGTKQLFRKKLKPEEEFPGRKVRDILDDMTLPAVSAKPSIQPVEQALPDDDEDDLLLLL
jgi:hypothetical protein